MQRKQSIILLAGALMLAASGAGANAAPGNPPPATAEHKACKEHMKQSADVAETNHAGLRAQSKALHDCLLKTRKPAVGSAQK
jgi:hypothetical protein